MNRLKNAIDNYNSKLKEYFDNKKIPETIEDAQELTVLEQAIIKESRRVVREIPTKLERWLELLETDGIDSKNMVATDIQRLLEEIKWVKN